MSELDLPAKPAEGVISSESIDYSILPECPPHMRNVTELANTPYELKATLPKYYASQIINLSDYTFPPISLFAKDFPEMTEDEVDIYKKFINYVMILIDSNDTCDKEGIRFLANVLDLLNGELSEKFRSGITGLSGSRQDVIKYAKSIAGL